MTMESVDPILKNRFTKKDKLVAVVVTFNRKQLLMECLHALINQTHRLDKIYVIDGPSTDGTPEYLLQYGFVNELPESESQQYSWETTIEYSLPAGKESVSFCYVRLYEDVGGSGGFYEGMKRSYREGYDWIWLMDDDSEPKEDALEKLINVSESVKSKGVSLGFLCSRVVWKDGSVHIMNVPQIAPLIGETGATPFNAMEDEGVLLVRGCSFVSVLINRAAVQLVGFPIKEFFIWGEDLEYTERITSSGYFGAYIRDSVVFHKTKFNQGVNIFTDEFNNTNKYFYAIRNELYKTKRQSMVRFFVYLIYSLVFNSFKILKFRKTNKFKFLWQNVKASLAAIIFNPRIDIPEKENF